MLSNSRFIYILLSNVAMLLASGVKAATLADSTVADTVAREQTTHQLTIGVEVARPVMNNLVSNKRGYELEASYYLKKELYLVAEGGWGSSDVAYEDLKYSTRNTFVRVGFNKILLPRDKPTDWGGMFMGMRAGVADISRSAATYTITDSIWGAQTASVSGRSFQGYWAELTGGVRVELVKGLMAGWNLRGKFLLNGKQFKDLAPLYVAGYGGGDKNAVFDINFYLSYAIRWKRR